MEDQKPDADIIAEFRKRQIRQWIATILAIAAILPMANGFVIGGLSEKGVALICIAVILGIAVFSLINWRCPSCEGYIGNKMSPKFCSKCGVRLME
ncbi:MAG: hypothetical protein NTX50_27365 [Candidatus Sumerlaeota bacterium]|nr:hypothetical protein [Candidatus Sumerlaeota bacterium]